MPRPPPKKHNTPFVILSLPPPGKKRYFLPDQLNASEGLAAIYRIGAPPSSLHLFSRESSSRLTTHRSRVNQLAGSNVEITALDSCCPFTPATIQQLQPCNPSLATFSAEYVPPPWARSLTEVSSGARSSLSASAFMLSSPLASASPGWCGQWRTLEFRVSHERKPKHKGERPRG